MNAMPTKDRLNVSIIDETFNDRAGILYHAPIHVLRVALSLHIVRRPDMEWSAEKARESKLYQNNGQKPTTSSVVYRRRAPASMTASVTRTHSGQKITTQAPRYITDIEASRIYTRTIRLPSVTRIIRRSSSINMRSLTNPAFLSYLDS